MSFLEAIYLTFLSLIVFFLMFGLVIGWYEERRNRRNCFRAFGTCEREKDGYCGRCHSGFYGGF